MAIRQNEVHAESMRHIFEIPVRDFPRERGLRGHRNFGIFSTAYGFLFLITAAVPGEVNMIPHVTHAVVVEKEILEGIRAWFTSRHLDLQCAGTCKDARS